MCNMVRETILAAFLRSPLRCMYDVSSFKSGSSSGGISMSDWFRAEFASRDDGGGGGLRGLLKSFWDCMRLPMAAMASLMTEASCVANRVDCTMAVRRAAIAAALRNGGSMTTENDEQQRECNTESAYP